ncbi:MAG: hypothetical protein KAX38_08720 [Candidatus Krumholzibacteria bacterium]|nr:hypothetical protein [Candidatus Krumholzibacteria bacterium]
MSVGKRVERDLVMNVKNKNRIEAFFEKREKLIVFFVLSLAAILLLINSLSAPYEEEGPDGLKYERFG